MKENNLQHFEISNKEFIVFQIVSILADIFILCSICFLTYMFISNMTNKPAYIVFCICIFSLFVVLIKRMIYDFKLYCVSIKKRFFNKKEN